MVYYRWFFERKYFLFSWWALAVEVVTLVIIVQNGLLESGAVPWHADTASLEPDLADSPLEADLLSFGSLKDDLK